MTICAARPLRPFRIQLNADNSANPLPPTIYIFIYFIWGRKLMGKESQLILVPI